MSREIKEPWGLSVFGAGSIKVAPQLVRIRLAIDVLEPTAGKAFTEANTAVSLLRETLRRYGIPDASVSGSHLVLRSEHDHTRKFLGYRCEAAYIVETTEIDRLQELLVDTVDAGANRVDDVAFDVRDKQAIRDEARRKAVEAARRKAEVYAQAAGVSLGPVIHIQDVDPEAYEFSSYRGHGSATGAGTESDLAPGMVEVQAGVVLGFAVGR
ncbi:SIMPL domain-containing protein [Streptomyces sp. NPDC051561]|uniref:SIMPL domain-containing protein n=1 Tax=Streptomyces sp. NPDC051561 TaxID=3365658 RepID=UPI0037A94984